jgi:hypothetical protein
MKKELQTRPTEKVVDDLRKKVKILQVIILSISNGLLFNLLFWVSSNALSI